MGDRTEFKVGQLPGGVWSHLFPQHQATRDQLWSGLKLCRVKFLQVNTLPPDLPKEKLARHMPCTAWLGLGAENMAAQKLATPSSQVFLSQHQLHGGKQTSSVSEASALPTTALVLGSHRPPQRARPLIVGSNRWQQRKQQNLRSQWPQLLHPLENKQMTSLVVTDAGSGCSQEKFANTHMQRNTWKSSKSFNWPIRSVSLQRGHVHDLVQGAIIYLFSFQRTGSGLVKMVPQRQETS